MSNNSASTAAASSAKNQTRLRRLRNQINPIFRRTFNYFHGPKDSAIINHDEMSSNSTAATLSNADSTSKFCCDNKISSNSTSSATEAYVYMGYGTVPENVAHVIVHESVTAIPNGVQRIRHNHSTVIPGCAFQGCKNLKTVVLPEGLIEIGHRAFNGCTSLENINFPSTLRVIGQYAFYNCTSLARVDFNEGLLTIGSAAFSGCRSILHLKVPSTVTTIGKTAFASCSALQDVQLCEGLLTIGDCAFIRLLTIGEGAFYECRSIVHLKIPSTVTTIGRSAFGHCWALKDVQLCEGLQTIEVNAFRCCYSLLSINIPSSVTTIGSGAFQQCDFLRNVAIAPDSILRLRGGLEKSDLLNNLHQAGGLLDSAKDRFDNLPLHRSCFYQTESATFLEEAKEHSSKENLTQKDCLGMTPLHILACSGRHDIGLYNFFVDEYPEALLIEDRWGETPLVYAILSEAPQEIIHFLFEKHRNTLNGRLPFHFLVMVEKLANKKGTNAEFLQSIIQAQRTYFPNLEIEWGRIVNEIVNENIGGDMHVKVFCVLVEASVSKRLWCMSPENRLAIDILINEIDAHRRTRGDSQRIVDCIQDYARQHREFLKNATTVLELALWNAAENATGRESVNGHQAGATIIELRSREESRVNCGAGIIIPLVLTFL